MKIIKYTKKKDGMYSLLLEDNDTVLVHEDLILKHGLLLNKELDDALRDTIEKENLNYTAKTVALKYITIRFRSEKELREYLKKKLVDNNNIDVVISDLKREGYINDESYAQMYINDRINLSMDGPDKVRRALTEAGIKESIINDKMEAYTKEIEIERINKIIDKQIKINHNKSNYMLKNKIINYLSNNGYSKGLSLECFQGKDLASDQDLAKKEYDKLYKKLSNKYSGSELEYKIKQKMYQKGFGSFE
jgi:regulatory protein